MNYSKFFGMSRNCFPYSFLVAWYCFSIHTCLSVFQPRVRGPLSLIASPLWYFARWILATLTSINSQRCVLEHRDLPASVWDCLPCTLAWKLSVSSKRRVIVGLTSFPFFQESLFCTACHPMPKSHSFIFSGCFLVKWFLKTGELCETVALNFE